MKDKQVNNDPMPRSGEDHDRILDDIQPNIPAHMLRKSSKKILNKRPAELPTTKKLRMKSLLWVKPSQIPDNSGPSSSSIFAQLIPTLIVNLAALSSGMSLGYSAIALPQLKHFIDYNSTFHKVHLHQPFTISNEEGSWVASMFGMGAIFGGFCAAYLGSQFGRRKSLMLLAIPDLMGWILIATARTLPMMLIGRFLNGFAAAGFCPSIQIYIAEIAQPQNRGWLSGITMPTLGLGALLTYITGALLPWHYVAALGALVPIFLLPGLVYLSDSPYWYLQNNNDKKALQVMERFRAGNVNGISELLTISDSLNVDADEFSLKDSIKNMSRRQYRRPFLILNFLFLLMVFSGNYAISFYAVEIFQKWQNSMDGYLATIIIGAIKLLGSLLYIPAIKYFSRRFLLCTSSFAMGVSLCILGLAMFSHDTGMQMGGLGDAIWIPLLCVTVYMLADPIGLGSIPFLYTAEFFPSEMRSLLSGITIGLTNLELFIVVKTFPNLSSMMGGSHGAFWLYGAVCFMAVLYVLLFVPETKGSSLQDIEGYFGRKESLHVTPFQTPLGTPAASKRGLAHYPHLSLQFTL